MSSARFSLRRLKYAVGLLVVGVGAALTVPATAASAAPHAAAATMSQTPLPVRNGSAANLGAYNASQTIRLAISLKPPHAAAEQQFLNEIGRAHV